MSMSMSRSMSRSIDTGSAPATGAGVCCEKQSFGEFGWVKLTKEQYAKLADRLDTGLTQGAVLCVDCQCYEPTNHHRRGRLSTSARPEMYHIFGISGENNCFAM